MRVRLTFSLWAASLAISSLSIADELARQEQIKAFGAAGFNGTSSACEIEETGNYTPVTMELVKDLNGDGRQDALITEGSASCYGLAGTGFYLVSRQPDGQWKLMASESGSAEFLASKGRDGWPDIQVVGPGSCFPVLRYDGERYRVHHRMGDTCHE